MMEHILFVTFVIMLAGGVVVPYVLMAVDYHSPIALLSIPVAVLGLFGLLYLAAQHESLKQAAFMSECERDRKQYECVAMWRGRGP